MNVLVTGGAGYIGSHTAMRLLEEGHAVTVVDDLRRGHRAAIEILEPLGDLEFVEADLGDRAEVARAMRRRGIELVMHFGALTYVGESVEEPLRYYRNNAAGSLGLLEAMQDAGVGRLVFSSTCATYGEPDARHVPIDETCPQHPISPYGRSKLMVEHMIRDFAASQARRRLEFAWCALRYFNVAGCDPAGRLGEDHDPETHLIPICLEVALGQRASLTIFGTDYPTPDGTCIRDYVHVMDLADAHLVAMAALGPGAALAYNVGIGRGFSVREVIDACRSVTGIDFRVAEGQRRPGDPPALFNNPARIERELGWRARRSSLEEIIRTAWDWKRAHPRGYAS
jgi:UDP-glucose 4-epimerase